MKYLAALALLLSISQAKAEELKLFHFTLSDVNSHRTEVDTSFFMNTKSKEGYVKVNVFEDKSYPHWGNWSQGPMPEPVVLVSTKTIRVPGLMLEGDDIYYQGDGKKTFCGYLGTSRIFKRPKIFLSGNCSISSKIEGNEEVSEIEIHLNVR